MRNLGLRVEFLFAKDNLRPDRGPQLVVRIPLPLGSYLRFRLTNLRLRQTKVDEIRNSFFRLQQRVVLFNLGS